MNAAKRFISETTNAQIIILSMSDSDNIFLVRFYVCSGHISFRRPVQVCGAERSGNIMLATRESMNYLSAQWRQKSAETIPKALHRFVISVSARNFTVTISSRARK